MSKHDGRAEQRRVGSELLCRGCHATYKDESREHGFAVQLPSCPACCDDLVAVTVDETIEYRRWACTKCKREWYQPTDEAWPKHRCNA